MITIVQDSSQSTSSGNILVDMLGSVSREEVQTIDAEDFRRIDGKRSLVLVGLAHPDMIRCLSHHRSLFPHLPRIAVVKSLKGKDLRSLLNAGADDVLIEEETTAEHLLRSIEIARHRIQGEQRGDLITKGLNIREEQLSHFMDHTNVGLAIADAEGRFLFANQGLAKLLGYRLDELLKLSISDVESEDAYARERDLIMEAAKNQRDSYRIEQQLTRKDGRALWVDLSVTILRDDHGTIQNLVGAIVDRTEQRKTERALEQSEQKYRFVTESLQEVVWMANASGEITFVNRWGNHLLGGKDADLLNNGWQDVMHPEDLKRTVARWRRSLEERVPYDNEQRMLVNDDTYHWFRVSAYPQIGEDDEVISWIGLALDIDTAKRTASELAESYERYELVTRATSDVIWDYDLVTNEITNTETFERVFGHTLIEMRRKDWVSYVHPEDRESVRLSLEKVLSEPGKETWSSQYRFIKADGSYAWVLDNATILRDERGHAYRMIGAMSDITERIEYERSIEEQNEKLKEIAWMQSHMVRAPLANLMALIELFDGSEVEEREQMQKMIYQSAHQLDQVIRNIVKNAERFERQESATSITRYGLLGEELNELYIHPAMLDLATRAYVITNKKDQLVYANQSFERLSGYSFEELRGEVLSKHLTGERSNKETLAFMDKREADRQPYESEVFWYTKNKLPFWVRITAQPFISKQGTFSGYFYTMKDISKEKEAEETIVQKTETLERINNELKNFTYAVSHDLKEPVNSLKALMGLLLDQAGEKLDQEEEEFIERAMGSIERISSMVKALLEYSRSSNTKEDVSQVKFEDTVSAVRDALQNQIQSYNAEITTTGGDTLMQVFPIQFSRIIQNLVNNSLKFRAEGRTPKIHLKVEEDVSHWMVQVEDNGIGIPKADLERVFDLFFYKSEVNHIDSHGIGLAVVKRLVEQHEGEIFVESTPNVGTRFKFTVRKNLSS